MRNPHSKRLVTSSLLSLCNWSCKTPRCWLPFPCPPIHVVMWTFFRSLLKTYFCEASYERLHAGTRGLIRVGVLSALGCSWGLGRLKAMRHRCGEGWQHSFGNRQRGEGLLGVAPPAEVSCKRAACLARVVWEVGTLQGAEWFGDWPEEGRWASSYMAAWEFRTDWGVKSLYFLIQFSEKEVEKEMCVSMKKEGMSVQVSLWLASVGLITVLEKIHHNVFWYCLMK